MSAHHNHGELGAAFMQTFQDLHAVHAREPDIQQDERGLHGIEPLPQTLSIHKYYSLISLVLQNVRYSGTDGGFVVYYIDGFI